MIPTSIYIKNGVVLVDSTEKSELLASISDDKMSKAIYEFGEALSV